MNLPDALATTLVWELGDQNNGVEKRIILLESQVARRRYVN